MPMPLHRVNTKLYVSLSLLYKSHMVTPAQIRAARGLLKWTQANLAHKAALSTVTLNMIENESVAPRTGTLDSIQRALEQGGVEFLVEQGQGVGVRFKRMAA
jgi:DNA-binding XRE family transcriptional regulator